MWPYDDPTSYSSCARFDNVRHISFHCLFCLQHSSPTMLNQIAACSLHQLNLMSAVQPDAVQPAAAQCAVYIAAGIFEALVCRCRWTMSLVFATVFKV